MVLVRPVRCGSGWSQFYQLLGTGQNLVPQVQIEKIETPHCFSFNFVLLINICIPSFFQICCSCKGEDGVKRVLEILQKEFDLTMANAGKMDKYNIIFSLTPGAEIWLGGDSLCSN